MKAISGELRSRPELRRRPDSRLYLEVVVIDLEPVAIGILEIHLFDAIGPYLGRFAIARPVAIFDTRIVKVFQEGFQGVDAESQVNIDIMGDDRFRSGYAMKLAMVAEAEPDMFAVMEGLRYLLQLDDFRIEIGTFLQVGDIHGSMVEMRRLGPGRLGAKAAQGQQGQYRDDPDPDDRPDRGPGSRS